MDKIAAFAQQFSKSGKGTGKHSGLQIQVLSLYRRLLRAAETKTDPNPIKVLIRQQFKTNAGNISKHAHQRIEFFIRQGQNQLAHLQSSQMEGVQIFGLPKQQ